MATIKGTDVIESGHLQDAIKEAEALKKAYDELDASILKTKKDIAAQTKGNRGNSAKEIEQLNVALQKSIKIKDAATKVDQEKARLEQTLIALRSEEMKQNEILKAQISEQRKQNKELAKETLGLTNAYDKLVRDTDKAQKEFKKLAAQHGINSKQAKKAKEDFEKLDNELREINQHARDGRRDVGRYGLALKGAAGGLKKIAGALGLVGGVQLFARVVKDAFNVVKNFDQATANLSSVLGVNKESMATLTEQAKQLGATTKFTASNVAELQLEFAKLGFTQKEIENVTEATLQLAAASGTELGNAAAIAGSTLRAFGLDTSETQRVVDVMAKSFSASSLDIDKFKAAMGSVAPVAKGAGFSIERTTSLLGTLTNAGIDASTAGTGLRNIFLELTKKGITFEEAMNKISTASDKNATSLALFGKRGAALGTILAENQGETDKLTKSLENSAGAAGEMADKQLDTLGGALDILRSSWEGAILEMNEASGASDGLKDLILVLADAIPHLVRGVSEAAGGIASFIKKLTGLKQAWSTSLDSQQNFSDALADTVDVLFSWIPGLSSVTDALLRTKTVLIKLTDEQIRNNKVNDQALKVGREILMQNKEEISDVSVLIDALMDENTTREEKNEIIDKLQADYPELLKNIDLETASTEALIQVKKDLIREILNQAIETKKAEALATLSGRIIDLELQKIGSNQNGVNRLNEQISELTIGFGLIEDVTKKVRENLTETIDGIDLSSAFREENEEIRRLQEELKQLNVELSNAIESGDQQRIDKTRKRIAEINKQLSDATGLRTKMLDDALDKEKGLNADGVKDFEDSEKKKTAALKKEIDQRNKDLEDMIAFNKKRIQEINDAQEKNDEARLLEIKRNQERINEINDQQEKDDKKRIDDIRKREIENFKSLQKSANETMKLIQTFADSRVAEIDRLIETQRQEIASSENEINRLQTLAAAGNNDAAESLKAEKIKQAKDKQEIEDLEKKKKNLLITISALNQANNLFQSGDVDGFKKASGNVKSFLDSLPQFYEGTETTVADALGSPHLNTSKDAYLSRLDGKEGVLTGQKMDALRSVGLRTTDQITNAAIKAQTAGIAMSAMSSRRFANYENREVVNELRDVKKAISGLEITNTHIDVKNLMEVIRKGNTTTRNDYNESKFKV